VLFFLSFFLQKFVYYGVCMPKSNYLRVDLFCVTDQSSGFYAAVLLDCSWGYFTSKARVALLMGSKPCQTHTTPFDY
jgi:hypothetical protein